MSSNTGTKSVERTWKSIVLEADPEFEASKKKQVEYEFSNGRKFSGNPAKRGAYAPDED